MQDMINRLNDLETRLTVADRQDSRLFQELLTDSVRLLGMQQQELAELFQVSPPTVSRWVSGSNAPHPAMRPVIYSELAKRARGFARKLAGERLAVA